MGVKANVAWQVSWQAVTDHYNSAVEDTNNDLTPDSPSTTAANGTSLTTSGFGGSAANASVDYMNGHVVASGTNKWSAQFTPGGSGQTLDFHPLTTSLGLIWKGTATVDADLQAAYSADIDATLNYSSSTTYYGTIYYKLVAV
jgi:hypothetical protein